MQNIQLIAILIVIVAILLSLVMGSIKPLLIFLFLTVVGGIVYLIAFKGVLGLTDFIDYFLDNFFLKLQISNG